MENKLHQITQEVYYKCGFVISNLIEEQESKEYDACRFDLNEQTILSRNAKITPKKVGQFVTFWKRNNNGIIEPFEENDSIGFFVVNVQKENRFGQFIFPKSVLIQKGIISTKLKEGKRAFRVYPIWDTAVNKQAQKTQKWQLDYFYEINSMTDYKKVKELYHLK